MGLDNIVDEGEGKNETDNKERTGVVNQKSIESERDEEVFKATIFVDDELPAQKRCPSCKTWSPREYNDERGISKRFWYCPNDDCGTLLFTLDWYYWKSKRPDEEWIQKDRIKGREHHYEEYGESNGEYYPDNPSTGSITRPGDDDYERNETEQNEANGTETVMGIEVDKDNGNG